VDRRQFFKRLFIGAGGLGSIASLDGFIIEPYAPVIERVTIPIPRLPEAFAGFRIVQLSDIHFGPYIGKSQIDRAVRMALSLQPDLTLLTGDFVLNWLLEHHGPKVARKAEPCAQALQPLRANPTYAVLGNHDYWNGAEIVNEIFTAYGIPVLRNQSLPIERQGKRLWLIGVDDVYEHVNDIDKALAGVPADENKIVAVHEPDFARAVAKHPVDLQLSGHSHGGQVWIPGIGAPILPHLAHKYPRGLNRLGNLQIYTNRGLGMVAPPVRLNCPPEVTLITLVAQT
jgi:uncharacterized protein